jgi:hypothetical protein
VDVDKDGHGVLRDGRLYQLVRERNAVREKTLKITFLEPGAAAYVFTFGWPGSHTRSSCANWRTASGRRS